MNELDLIAALEHSEAVYLYCRRVAIADRVPLPPGVREFLNREVPALLGELRRLRAEQAAATEDSEWEWAYDFSRLGAILWPADDEADARAAGERGARVLRRHVGKWQPAPAQTTPGGAS